MLRLTRTARIRLVVVADQITEGRSVNLFVDLAADAGVLVLYDEILQRLTEAEVGQRNEEYPFKSFCDLFCAKFWYLQNHNSQHGHGTCIALYSTPC